MSGATAVDWEDIAAGPGPVSGVAYLYLADIGDNAKARTSVQVYRVREPLVNPSVAPGPRRSSVGSPRSSSRTPTVRTTPRR